jgi:hypothetical protein
MSTRRIIFDRQLSLLDGDLAPYVWLWSVNRTCSWMAPTRSTVYLMDSSGSSTEPCDTLQTGRTVEDLVAPRLGHSSTKTIAEQHRRSRSLFVSSAIEYCGQRCRKPPIGSVVSRINKQKTRNLRNNAVSVTS